MLHLTSREVNLIISDSLEPFKLIKDYLPIMEGDNPDDYIEDDGRQYRICEFEDTRDNETYSFNYISYPDDYSNFPWDFLSDASSFINIVQVSQLYPPVVKEVEKVLSPAEQADKDLMDKYRMTEVHPFTSLKESSISNKEVSDICKFLNSKKFSMIDLREKIIPVCIKHNIEQKSFWQFLQKESRKSKYKTPGLE